MFNGMVVMLHSSKNIKINVNNKFEKCLKNYNLIKLNHTFAQEFEREKIKSG